MKNTFKRFLSFVLILLMSVSVLMPASSPFAMKASANKKLETSYSRCEGFNLDGYESKNIAQVDIVKIAQLQSGKNKKDIGYKFSGGWCAAFVSDCAKLAGAGDVIPWDYNVRNMYHAVLNEGGVLLGTTKNGKLPCQVFPGDLIFYNPNSNGHVAIVSDSAGISVHGNVGGKTWSGPYHHYKDTNGNLGTVYFVRPNYKSNYLREISCNKEMQAIVDTTLRLLPYDKTPIMKNISTGTKLNVVASYINIRGNTWYKTDSGYWIYSGKVTELPINTVTYKTAKSTNQKKTKAKIELPAPAIVVEDQPYTIPAEIPVRNGYKFMGWALTEDAKEAQFQAGDIISADDLNKLVGKGNGFSLYPVWKQTETTMKIDKYEVSLNVSEKDKKKETVEVVCTGDLENVRINMTCGSDNENVATAKVTYSFLEQWFWWDKLTNKIEIEAKNPGTANIKVEVYNTSGKLLISKSVFVKVDASYNISYYDDADGKITNKQTKKYNKDITLLDYVPEKEGNVFLGWTTAKGSSTVEYGPGDKYEGNKDLTLYPVWKEKYEIKYEVNNGVLRIYGKGDMASYPTGKTPWASYASQITEIKIESGVTSIGARAFDGFTNLTKVTMPYGITKIGAKSFNGCKKLESINIPPSASVGNRAFANCTKLQEVTMPAAATRSATEVSIGAFAFENCVSLASVDIPDTVTDIGEGAFTACTAMEEFEIPAGVEVINDSTFFGCSSLEDINVPSGVTEIGDGAFSGCSAAETIIIPNTVDSIGDQAFSGCSVVTEVDIPESVDTIGAGAFTNCSALTTVDLPDDMEYIGEGMFSGCSALESVEIPDTVSYIGDGAFGYCSSLTGVDIPENVSEINNSTFYGCSSLQSFEVPATVVSIGDYAFGDCDNLKNVTISEGTASIGVGAFAFCDTLETVSVPASLTLIDDGAFMDCASLTNIDLLESELVIGEDAFYGCSSLTDIQLPESIVSIGEGAFDDCSADFSLACFSTSSVYEQVVDTYDNVNTIYPVSGITLDKSEVDLLVGQTLNLNATVAPVNATCKDIIWSSNNPDYVSVDGSGKVTALDGGRVTITATTKDNAFVASCVINSIVPVKDISLGYNEVEAYVGEEFTMYYTFAPENPTDIEVEWSSSNENVATVSEDGTVKILSEGEATITVTTNDGGFKDNCIINATDYIEATGITIDETLEIAVGESKQLQAQITPSNATSKDIFWLVEDMEIAEISDEGTVTAIKEGTTKIYAYAGSEEGPEAICTVTVKLAGSAEPDLPPKDENIVTISICKPSTNTINYGDTLVLHVELKGTNIPEEYSILWSIDGNGMSINPSDDGLTCTVTSVQNGKVTVKATLVDENGNVLLDGSGNEVSTSQELNSKVNFWLKIVSFFKNLFRINRIIPE